MLESRVQHLGDEHEGDRHEQGDHLSRESAKNKLATSTTPAMPKWIHMLRSKRSAWTMPSNAQLKLRSRLPRRAKQGLPVDELKDLGLAHGHLPGVDLVIVAQQMKRAVHQQHSQLEGRRQAVGARLAQSLARTHDDVA